MVDLIELKRKIVNIVQTEGPVLPVQISRKVEKDTIFAGAVLSELVSEKTIRVSYARIGGSPLYYVSGQESKLMVLYDHLPGKEKEVYELLRKNQILEDTACEPAVRVALRSIRDFSIPIEIEGKLYWRWYLTSEDEARQLVKKPEIKKEIKIFKERVRENTRELKPDVVDDFFTLIKNYFVSKNIRVLELHVIRKRREIEGRIRINSDLGALDYLIVAKNKKRLNEADLSLASDKGRKNKLPVLFLSNGDLSKKAFKYLDENLGGRVIFRKVIN